MNNVCLSGRLTADPDLRYGQSGSPVCRFTLAVDRPRQKDKADFPNIVCFGKTAEAVAQYRRKGQEIEVVGIIATDKYEGKDGKTVYKTEVLANEVKFIGGSKKQDNQGQSEPAGNTAAGDWESLGREIKPGDLDMFDGGQDESEIPF